MDAKTYLSKISIVNLIFLLVGIVIGIACTSGLSSVHAQAQSKETIPTKDVPSTKVERASPPLDSNAEYVSPGVSLGGPVVTNTLLANRIACDRLQVNGFEPLRLNDAILSALAKKGILTSAEVQSIVEAGKAEHPLRIKPQ